MDFNGRGLQFCSGDLTAQHIRVFPTTDARRQLAIRCYFLDWLFVHKTGSAETPAPPFHRWQLCRKAPNVAPATRGFAGEGHIDCPLKSIGRGITCWDHDERTWKIERGGGQRWQEKGIAEGTKIMGLNSAGKTGRNSSDRQGELVCMSSEEEQSRGLRLWKRKSL